MTSIFGKYVGANKATTAAMTQEVIPTDNPEVVVVPVIDDKPGEITDPLDGVDQSLATESLGVTDDAFEAQRAQRNADMDRDLGLESLTTEIATQEASAAAPTQETETQAVETQVVTQDESTQTVDTPVVATQDAGTTQEIVPTQEASQDASQITDASTQEAPKVDLDSPVDGADDKLTVSTTDSDADVAEGEHGKEAEITGPEDDIEVDADDSSVEFDQSIDQLDALEQDYAATESLMQEIGMLTQSSIAIENYGFNPTAAGILQATGLLNGTALESLGLESINFTAGKDAESQMALESLGEKIKEKSAQWSAKVLHVAKSSGEKLLGVLEPMWDKISSTSKALASAAWDKTKAAGSVIKAHPFATIATVIAAIGAVAAAVAFASTGAPAPGAKIDAMRSFLTKLAADISKIKFPGGSVKATVGENGTRLITSFSSSKEVVKAVSAESAGWTATTMKVMQNQLDRAWTLVKHAWTAFGTRAVKIAGSAVDTAFGVIADANKLGNAAGGMAATRASKIFGNSTAGKIGALGVGAHTQNMVAGAYIMAIIGVIRALFALTRFVVVGGFKMILSTLRALTPQTATA